MNGKTVASSRMEMSEVMTPSDANFLGKVFGGKIFALLDLCAYATSSRFAETICVTASIDRVDFLEPIEVGELVTCVGHVTYVGRTSLEITLAVSAQNVFKGTSRHTNTARVTMVAIGSDSRPIPVPRLVCETRDERIQFIEGKLRRSMRDKNRKDFDELAASYRQMNDSELDALILG